MLRQYFMALKVLDQWTHWSVSSRPGDTLTEAECEVEWTKAIAPRVEGRIRMVGEEGV
ncbi:MAG: hypothetical protein STHCBS139747_002407 [Sporothrix thermara]